MVRPARRADVEGARRCSTTLLPQRLAPRFILALTVLVAGVTAISAWLNAREQREQLLERTVLGIDQLSRSIASATWETMPLDRREAACEIIRTIGADPEIDSIRIFNKEGRVTFSTDSSAPRQVDKNAEACFMCHAREEPLVRVDVPSRARIYRGRDGRRKVSMVTPIYNEPACANAGCHAHPPDKTVLGVLDVVLPLDRVDHEVAQVQIRTLASTGVEIALMAALIGVLTRQFVGRPIEKLIRGTKAISDMQLDHPIEVEARGELGALADSFNVMREQLRVALAELNAFTEQLERKVEERSRQPGDAQEQLIRSDRLASLGQLSATVAHEINNPIAGVLSMSMLMQRFLGPDGIPPDKVEDFRRYLASTTE